MHPFVPLNAFRAFEAAARTGSFANAARELGVSSAAISQQVKLLEEFWNETLFIRQGNRIALTDAGLTAYPSIAESMAGLTDISSKMRRRERRKRLVLSVPQSIAETWLAHRLATLETPDLKTPLSIRIDEDPVDFVRDEIDMRVFYGHDLYGDYRVEPLLQDQLIAVAAPGFIATHGADVTAIADRYLIHTDWGRGFSTSPDWNAFNSGDRIVDRSIGMLVQASSTALSFVRQGFGAAIVPQRMAQDDLNSGRITRLELDPVQMPHDYRIAFPKRLMSDAVVRSVIKALRG